MGVVVTLSLGVVGALGLWGLYRALETNWPTQYISLNDTFALSVTQSWWKLFLFRSVPIFIAGIAIGATSTRLGGSVFWSVLIAVGLHIAHTNVVALWESFGRGSTHDTSFRINYASYHLAVIFVAVLSGGLAWYFTPALMGLVPQPGVLLENLWIALFVSVAGGVTVSVIGKRSPQARGFDGSYYAWRATRDVGIELVDFAFTEALANGTDPLLLRSIMFAEVLQRPRWVRVLERARGRFIKSGSYGVTQETASAPITDQEAISRTVARVHGRWALKNESTYVLPDEDLIWRFAAQHNDNVAFIHGVKQIYSAAWATSRTLVEVPYSLPFVVFEVRRYGSHAGLRFIVWKSSHLRITYRDPVGGASKTDSSNNRSNPGAGDYWATELRLELGVHEFEIHYETSGVQHTYPAVLRAVTAHS